MNKGKVEGGWRWESGCRASFSLECRVISCSFCVSVLSAVKRQDFHEYRVCMCVWCCINWRNWNEKEKKEAWVYDSQSGNRSTSSLQPKDGPGLELRRETLLINYPKIYVYHFLATQTLSFERRRLNATKAVISSFPSRTLRKPYEKTDADKNVVRGSLFSSEVSSSSSPETLGSLVSLSSSKSLCELYANGVQDQNLFGDSYEKWWSRERRPKQRRLFSFTISLAKHI